MKNFISLFIVFCCFMGSVFAQPDQAAIETKNGKKYYVHIVQKGNTLYGIHQLYNTSLEDILNANDGLSNNLALGQKVYIPIPVTNPVHYNKHTVVQGETLYGISKKYDCSIDDLKSLNDGLSEGLSIGQVLIIPKKGGETAVKTTETFQSDPVSQPKNEYCVSLHDSIITHTVMQKETMYSITKRYMVSQDTIMALNDLRSTKLKKGMELKIPVKRVNYTVLEKDLSKLSPEDSILLATDPSQFKETYNVALMLPLLLDKNDAVMSKPARLGEVKEMYGTTKISFDFYQGFMLAADSLTKAGVNLNIYIYDTKRDTNTLAKIFAKPEFNEMDLVVGPLYQSTISYTAKECAERKIRMVLPFNADAKVLYKNPYVYKGVTSNMSLMSGTVDYVLKAHKEHNIILVKPTGAEDIALYETVKKKFNDSVKNVKGAYNSKIIEVDLGSSSGRDWNTIVKSDTTNIFIIPSTSLTFVSGAMARLNKVMNLNPYAKNLKIIAFGLEDWNKYDDMDLKYRNRTYQHYASYRYLDYNAPHTVDFIRSFRTKTGTDPNVYSTQGFDFGFYFLSALYKYGTNFDKALKDHKLDLIQNDFNFKTVEQGSGYENQRVCIVKYDNYVLYQMQ